MREQVASGFKHLPSGKGTLEIRFNFNELAHKAEIQWNEHGTANATWRIPANAKLGRYVARITDSASGATYDAQFQVEEFRTPVFDAKLSGAPVWRTATQQELPIEASLNFLAGGAAAGEKVSVQGRWTMSAPAPVAGFDFTNRRVVPFATQTETARPLTLDNKGEARTTLTPPATQNAITLLAEMQFSDPNGEVQTIAQRYAVWPYPNKVGARATVTPDTTGNATRAVELVGVVLDATNKPLAAKSVQFTAARARSNGNGFFDLTGEEKPACQGSTNAQGQARCDWQPGPYISTSSNNELWLITARVEGEQHIATATLNDWQLRWVGYSTNVLLTAPALGIKSIKDLIALAQAQPGKMLFSSGGAGSNNHMTAELFRFHAAIKATHVGFKSGSEALIEVLAGRVHYCMANTSTALPFIKDGRLLALGVTTQRRSPLLPSVPAIVEVVPGFKNDASYGLYAPAGTPRPVLHQISKEVARILELYATGYHQQHADHEQGSLFQVAV